MDFIYKILAYYAWGQSYLDPLGKPCMCVSCDHGEKAQIGLRRLETMAIPEDFPIQTVRAVLEFYATGVAYTTESPAYGEHGKLAEYALKTLEIDGSVYQVPDLWKDMRLLPDALV